MTNRVHEAGLQLVSVSDEDRPAPIGQHVSICAALNKFGGWYVTTKDRQGTEASFLISGEELEALARWAMRATGATP